MSKNDLVERYGESYIKHEVIDRVETAIEECGEHDYDWKNWEHKSDINTQRHLSELYEMFSNFTQSDCAIAVIIALENFPEMVIELLKDYVREKIVSKERKTK